MNDFALVALTALWLGILTSVSPCPAATNVAAVSYIGRRLSSSRGVVAAVLLYTLGRVIAYVALGALLVSGLLSAPGVSMFLQRYMNALLGPVLIVAGVFLTGLLRPNLPGTGAGEKAERMVELWGVWSAIALGALFALSFCPVSAALFFGSLLPLALKAGSRVTLPALYGIGTAMPAVVFAALVTLGVQVTGATFEKLTRIEPWARRVTGAVFIVVGVYYCLAHVFNVL